MDGYKTIAAIGLALAAGGCAANSFSSTWRNPATQPVTLAGQPVIALVISTEESTRRVAEDEVARRITERGGRGIPAYTLLKTPDIEDEQKARDAFKKAGAVGVVTMEIVGERRQPPTGAWHVSVSRGPAPPFWGRYGRGWAVAHRHPMPPDIVVWLETHVFSLDPEELIWAARSRTTNPSRAQTLFGRLAEDAARQMEREGLLTPVAQ